MVLLFAACYLCKYPFLLRGISLYDIFKQIGSAACLLLIMILISGLFVEYTSIYQENHSLFSFIVHQIIFIGFFEELLFRGVLVYIARKFISSEILIVVLCSLAFAFSHINTEVFSILQITSSFIIGIAFTLLILKLPDYFSVYNIGIVHGLFNVLILGFTTYMQFNWQFKLQFIFIQYQKPVSHYDRPLLPTVFLLLNMGQLMRTDWETFSYLDHRFSLSLYNFMTIMIATDICVLVAFLFYRFHYDRFIKKPKSQSRKSERM